MSKPDWPTASQHAVAFVFPGAIAGFLYLVPGLWPSQAVGAAGLILAYTMIIAMGLPGDVRATAMANALLASLAIAIIDTGAFSNFSAEERFAYACVFIGTGAALSLFIASSFTRHPSLIDSWRKLAQTDSLLDVSNRRHFMQVAALATENAHVTRQPLAVLMLDVDRLKKVNDAHGHETGDAVLRAVVSACVRNLRADDFVGRIGGEEFALLLPDATPVEADEIANRLRTQVANVRISTEAGRQVRPTISIGGCILHRRETVTSVLRRADAALRMAKRNGRNRVMITEAAGRSSVAGTSAANADLRQLDAAHAVEPLQV